MDDSTFTGLELATLIRNKYGRSYDAQLVKKVCYLTREITCKISFQSFSLQIWSIISGIVLENSHSL